MPEASWDRGVLLWAMLALLACSRLGELLVSQRNLARLRASGVPQRAASSPLEYGLMVALHVLYLLAPLVEFHWRGERGPRWPLPLAIVLLAAAQGLRLWSIRALGPRWNARAVVAISLGAVHDGPYRFLRHPSYLAVAVEFAALPWIAGTFISGALLFCANAVLLARRIRQEERLMSEVPGWQSR